MTTPPLCRCIPVALLALTVVGCGNDPDPSLATSPAAATTPTLGTPLSTRQVPGVTDATPVSASIDIPLPPLVTSDAPITIEVTVGVDSSPDRREAVPLGSTVSLSVTNPSSDDEFHVHGYDLGDGIAIPAGRAETWSFVADRPGEFEVESHETGNVLLTLSVA